MPAFSYVTIKVMIIVVLILLGLCAGSFVNALVWRIHEQQKTKKLRKELSIAKGRSMCPHCKHTLAWYDLLPVMSWVALKGKCRYCKKGISAQYPLVELSTSALFVLSYYAWSHPFNASHTTGLILWLITLVGLMALFIYDLRWMLLPNRILFPLFIPAVAYSLVNIAGATNPLRAALDNLVSVIFLGGLFWILFQVSNGKWIGGGDVKLGFLLGLLVGLPSHSILTLFLGSLIGTVIAVPLLLTHKAKTTTRLPFGPFLITASVFVVLYGTQTIDWYNRIFLLT